MGGLQPDEEDSDEEEGVDDEEIIKRVKNEVTQKLIDKRNKYSRELFEFAEKRVMLFQIDKDWREHLAAMDMLRGLSLIHI